MQYTPAAQHNQALIAWLQRHVRANPSDQAAARDYANRLRGEVVPYGLDADGDGLAEPRLFGRKRTHAMWLREHVASEPASLLKGVVL